MPVATKLVALRLGSRVDPMTREPRSGMTSRSEEVPRSTSLFRSVIRAVKLTAYARAVPSKTEL